MPAGDTRRDQPCAAYSAPHSHGLILGPLLFLPFTESQTSAVLITHFRWQRSLSIILFSMLIKQNFFKKESPALATACPATNWSINSPTDEPRIDLCEHSWPKKYCESAPLQWDSWYHLWIASLWPCSAVYPIRPGRDTLQQLISVAPHASGRPR